MTGKSDARGVLLLQNLLDRLDADAEGDRPQFRGVVSDAEREALRALLQKSAGREPAPDRPIESTVPTVDNEVERPPPAAAESPLSATVPLDKTALALDASPNPDWVLCLDFGTAKSKAFAATNHEEEPELEPLPIGLADEDRDGAVYEVYSSVWIADDGRLFVGSEAVVRHMAYGGDRELLHSLKQQISQVALEGGAAGLDKILPGKMDPTSTLTFGDAITIYLAYLTDLASSETERRIGTRYIRRRFTVPGWRESQRSWAAAWIGRRMLRAQILADTFHGRWRGGIPVRQVKEAVRAVSGYDDGLAWLAATGSNDLSEWRRGTLEALAAGSARLWTDGAARSVMLVVDVGAGTTDLALFWVVQDQGKFRRAWPIGEEFEEGIRQAGDQLDECFVEEVMAKAGLGVEGTGKRARDKLRQEGVRLKKEELFRTGRVTAELPNDEIVTLTRDEFIRSERVTRFSKAIANRVGELLDRVRKSWHRAAEHGLTMVLTGGGCDLPMITDLVNQEWRLGERKVRFRLAPRVPDGVTTRFSQEFVQEYPKLAVAMGGALDTRLDEKNPMSEWMGGTAAPGGLEHFPTRGV